MNTVVLSFFRNVCDRRVHQFMQQVADLITDSRRSDISLVAVYGDSKEDMPEILERQAQKLKVPMTLVRHDHGGPHYGSTENPARMRDLSGVANAGLDKVYALTLGNCQVLYVESDLLWDPHTILRLFEKLRLSRYADAIAPLVFAGEHFYDVYAFRGLDGSRFAPFAPYHADLKIDELTEVSSVGSCFVMKGTLLRDTRIINDGALIGFWEAALRNGHRVFVDSTERVEHPL